MPVFREVEPQAKERLVNKTAGFQQRKVYRDHLSQIADGDYWEIEPEAGETLRRLKVNVRRAGNELGLNIQYGETNEGTLLVWSEPPSEKSGRRRGRPRKASEAS